MYVCCYATMCPAGIQGAVRSRQVHQLKQGTNVGRMLFNVTDITSSLAEPHFKATRRLLGELLKVNTATLSFPPQIQGLRQIQFFHNKKMTLNCRVCLNKINDNKRNREKTIQIKVRSEKVFLYLGGDSTKIFVTRTRSHLKYLYPRTSSP